MPGYAYKDGQMIEVPDIVVSESGELHEDVNATLVIERGVSLTMHGVISGTANVLSRASLDARNDVNGTVTVEADAEATFHRLMGGTLGVAHGGRATLRSSAVATGTINNDGTLVNEGTRGRDVHGVGVVDDREGSSVRPPDLTFDDGTTIYFG